MARATCKRISLAPKAARNIGAGGGASDLQATSVPKSRPTIIGAGLMSLACRLIWAPNPGQQILVKHWCRIVAFLVYTHSLRKTYNEIHRYVSVKHYVNVLT